MKVETKVSPALRVKIVNTDGSPTPWYRHLKGSIYEVEPSQQGLYKVVDHPLYFTEQDVEVVEDTTHVEDTTQPVRNKYSREIRPGVFVDVYDVLRAFNVTDPCLQHLLKKALAVGQRGHKDALTDYKDILASAKRAVEMYEEWYENAK